jgi:hypothetical protein
MSAGMPKKTDKFVEARLGIMHDKNQFIMFKTRPTDGN